MEHMFRFFRNFVGLIVLVAVVSCGSPRTGSKGKSSSNDEAEKNSESVNLACGESSHDNSVGTVRLKGAALVAKTFQATLGEGITKDSVSGGDLLNNEAIVQNFGTSKDGIYADVKSEDQTMSAYLMSLNYVGRTAAVNCSLRNFEGLCKCDTEEMATEMLQRAITFRRFCTGTDDSYVLELVSLCKKSPADAITSLMTSLAITLLQ
jgi:hypothetical protein